MTHEYMIRLYMEIIIMINELINKIKTPVGGLLIILLIAPLGLSCSNNNYKNTYARLDRSDSHVLSNVELGRILDATVKIYGRTGEFLLGSGSGVLVDTKDGTRVILTARHVAQMAEVLSFVLRDECFERPCKISVLGDGDWAILTIDPMNAIPEGFRAEFGDDWDLEIGDFVEAVGYALGAESATFTEGRFQDRRDGMLRTSAPIIYGNSGGGLYAIIRGRPYLVGLTVAVGQAKGNAVPHFDLAVPISTVRSEGKVKF